MVFGLLGVICAGVLNLILSNRWDEFIPNKRDDIDIIDPGTKKTNSGRNNEEILKKTPSLEEFGSNMTSSWLLLIVMSQ